MKNIGLRRDPEEEYFPEEARKLEADVRERCALHVQVSQPVRAARAPTWRRASHPTAASELPPRRRATALGEPADEV